MAQLWREDIHQPYFSAEGPFLSSWYPVRAPITYIVSSHFFPNRQRTYSASLEDSSGFYYILSLFL